MLDAECAHVHLKQLLRTTSRSTAVTGHALLDRVLGRSDVAQCVNVVVHAVHKSVQIDDGSDSWWHDGIVGRCSHPNVGAWSFGLVHTCACYRYAVYSNLKRFSPTGIASIWHMVILISILMDQYERSIVRISANTLTLICVSPSRALNDDMIQHHALLNVHQLIEGNAMELDHSGTMARVFPLIFSCNKFAAFIYCRGFPLCT